MLSRSKARRTLWLEHDSIDARLNLLESPKWTDLRFPATAINPPGQTSDPDYDTTNAGWLFDASTTEVLAMIGQFPHGYLEGSDIYPHVHWIQNQDQSVAWKLEYKWYNNNSAVPSSFTAINTDADVFTYTSGNLAQISTFPSIDGTGKRISSILILKFSRVGTSDSYSGDATFIEFDIHYQKDSLGSLLEYTK